jgi:hypothetical protein
VGTKLSSVEEMKAKWEEFKRKQVLGPPSTVRCSASPARSLAELALTGPPPTPRLAVWAQAEQRSEQSANYRATYIVRVDARDLVAAVRAGMAGGRPPQPHAVRCPLVRSFAREPTSSRAGRSND